MGLSSLEMKAQSLLTELFSIHEFVNFPLLISSFDLVVVRGVALCCFDFLVSIET